VNKTLIAEDSQGLSGGVIVTARDNLVEVFKHACYTSSSLFTLPGEGRA